MFKMAEEIKLKKINDYEWELPKIGKMLVPGKIFASEKLIEKIKQDKTLEQVRNVAMLPGILKASIACPDAHQGYGFSIGGVAAFPVDTGIVSPGGVGFDINCLTGDAKILTEFGTYKQIKDFESDLIEINSGNQKLGQIQGKIPSLNVDSKKIENKEILMFLKKEAQDIFEIETENGFKIKATADHPFLTRSGMKNLAMLDKEEVAVFPFEGIEEKEEIDRKKAIIAKIFGYFLGDGTVYFTKGRGYSVAYGKREDLEKMKGDLESIGFNSSIYYRERDHEVFNQYKIIKFRAGSHELHVRSGFAHLLETLGMPIGNKTKQKFLIPSWIKDSPKHIKRLFLAGLFGAEMNAPNTHTKTGFYCPTFGQNKINELKDNMKEFMLELSELLLEFGIKINKISEINYPKVSTIRLIISAEEENFLKLLERIGFEYNEERQNIAKIAVLYILKKKKITKWRTNIANKVKEYRKKGFSLREIQKVFESKITNKRFLERHFYEDAGQRIPLTFISFKDFREKCSEDLKLYGCLFDKLKSIKKIGKEQVYDFTIKDNHNFIANSFIVSNCGVRLLATNILVKDFMKKRKEILHDIYRTVPSGVGRGRKERLTFEELDEVLKNGVEWALQQGKATKEDLERCEEYGKMDGNPKDVSKRAKQRGLPQLGTLGAGNHFLEMQKVEEIFDQKIAKIFGISKDNLVIMIHCGSRGLGHQVASDYIKAMEDEYGIKGLPDRELINAPIKSELGKKYISAMNCAVNFAFCNRQLIMHDVRQVLERYFPGNKNHLVYDVCHNVAKIEEHEVDGKKMKLCIHRKGATRSFGPGRKEIPKVYRDVGQPVIIPGSMGTSSYLLVGTKKAEEISWGSTAHGAGRVMSRHQALNQFRGEQIKQELKDKDIEIEAGGWKSIAEEAPGVYKDIDEVVKVSHKLGIGNLVAKVKPLAVMKG